MTDVSKSPDALPIRNLDRIPVHRVPIDSLVVGDSPRRSSENVNHTRNLAEVQGQLPPILVHRPTMRVLDGLHRLRAAKLCRAHEIDVRFVDGDEASSFVLAVHANVTHGLPLSLAERKYAAARIADSYPEWSDRAIASLTGLAHKTVAVIRERLHGENGQLDARVGRDGRLRPRNSAERREIARKLIEDNPRASLREIAQRAQISPETARAVRANFMRDRSKDTSQCLGASSDPKPVMQNELPRRRTGHAMKARQGDSSPARMSALQSLKADPAFRSTQSGRLLLRMLSTYEIIQDYDRQLISQIPQHCIGRMASSARECAIVWQKFADQLEQQDRKLP